MGADPEGGGHHAGLGYHASMVADPHRMAAFAHALRLAVKPGMRVLDVGTGTGVLAVMAAQLGAREVVAVESTSIAHVARRVFADNGVTDRVRLIHGDIRALAPPADISEYFDVIVSDCLGRFVVDDFMFDPIAHVRPWLREGGLFIPERVALWLAPVTANSLSTLDAWSESPLGVDLSSVAAEALHHPFGASFAPQAVMAEAQRVAHWTPGDRALSFAPADAPFCVTRPGPLRGFAGWFIAELGHGVQLSTAPGRETHWAQLLFPVAARDLSVATEMSWSLGLLGFGREPIWRWRLGVAGGVAEHYGGRIAFDDALMQPPSPQAGRESESWAILQQQATDALGEGGYAAAADGFVATLRGALSGGPLSPETRQRLLSDAGLALALADRPSAALGYLLAAMDDLVFRGELPPDAAARESLEQVLRLTVDSCFRVGRALDGQRFLALYEAHFGPHPAGWRPADAP